VTGLGRFARGRRPDRNPLRRASDVIETAMLAVLVVAFTAAAPFAVQQSGAWMYATQHQAQLTQQAARHQVTALVLPWPKGSPVDSGRTAGVVQVLARWTAPDGTVVTGQVPEPPGTAPGATVPVWVTADGQLASEPLRDSQVAGAVFLTQMLSVLGLAVLVTGVGALGRRALDKRRMAAWDAEWRVTGPRWTTRTLCPAGVADVIDQLGEALAVRAAG
jgi:hypothetical protein